MKLLRTLLLAPLFAALIAGAPSYAVQPDEVLDDVALEERARDISAGLRCPVCQNESIDESSAEISRDLRLLVRERLLQGDTNQQAVDYIVARYGEYVLLRPDFTGANLVLWLLPIGLLVGGLGLSLIYIRGRSVAGAAEDTSLDDAEQARLDTILSEDDRPAGPSG